MSRVLSDETVPPAQAAGMTRFVRETLGCGCPDEVVSRTAIDTSPEGETGLDVGGRLLVRVLRVDDLDRFIETFPLVVERLRDERDRRGFRRVRLVVIHSETELLYVVLDGMLKAIAVADEGVFLHVIPFGGLPASLC